NPAIEKQNLERELKGIKAALDLKEKEYELDIAKAKGKQEEIANIGQKRIAAARQAAQDEQAVRNRFADAAALRGNKELAEEYRTGGGSLRVKELGFEKQALEQQQSFEEATKRAAISAKESERRIAD